MPGRRELYRPVPKEDDIGIRLEMKQEIKRKKASNILSRVLSYKQRNKLSNKASKNNLVRSIT